MKLYFLRLWYGVKKLVHRPLYNILVLLVVGTAWFSLKKWDTLLAFVHIKRPWLLPIGGMDIFVLVDISIVLLSVMILSWLITGIATTFRAIATERKIKAALISAEQPRDITIWPALVYQTRKKEDGLIFTERIFYSPEISLARWIDAQTDIFHALNCHPTADIQHGGKDHEKGHLIVVKTRPGIAPKAQNTPIDPLFK